VDRQRVFVCVEIPEPESAKLVRAQSLLPDVPCIRPVRQDQMHITLSFLGDVTAAGIESVDQAVAQAACSVPSFRVSLAGLGAFPKPDRARVVWAGITEGHDDMRRLQKAVAFQLETRGFDRERAPWLPHVTLARIRPDAGPSDLSAIEHVIAGSFPNRDSSFMAGGITVMRSVLVPSGSTYSRLSEYRLR
jgi:2'-5' RNA ligase